MSALPVTTLRQRVAAAMPSGFVESAQLFDTFGDDPTSVNHKAFAVGVSTTEANELDRRARSEGALVFSTVVIRCAYSIRPMDQVTSYDEALTLEQSVITGMATITLTDIGGMSYEGSSRRALTSAFVISEVTFTFQHRIALS
jgi:hypothetical protein